MGKLINSVLTIKLLIFIQVSSEQLRIAEYEYCTDNNDLCRKLSECPSLHEPIKNGYHPKICGFNRTMPIVCCTTGVLNTKEINEGDTISSKMCVRYKRSICPNIANYIEGGDPAHAKELPFMALIGYGEKSNIDWQCAGSLISERFVLSAAHCAHGVGKGSAKWIRLGDSNYEDKTDDAKPQDFSIRRIITHPNYSLPSLYNDIALFELDRDVHFNEYIRPICLYQSTSLNEQNKALAAGWGRTSFVGPLSKQLMKVELDIFDVQKCGQIENKLQFPMGVKGESMICAGSKEGGKDTCVGDSGGPLFLTPDNSLVSSCLLYEQIGITSSGKHCGLPEFPGIYTKVFNYLHWIESRVWRLEIVDMPEWTD